MSFLKTKAQVLLAVAASTIFLATNTHARPGDLDLSFGKLSAGGVRTFTMTNWFHPCCMTQQSDGKLLVAGMLGGEGPFGSDGRLVLRRHLVTNGNLDSTFGMGGEAVASGPYPASFVWGRPESIAVQPDGKILVVGAGPPNGKPVVWRFTTAGQLDITFGAEGVQNLSTLDGMATGAAFHNGKIFIVENIWSNTDYLLRRNTNGASDSTFGLFGLVNLQSVGPTSIAIDPLDGAMYVTFGTNAYEGFVRRYFANGAVDTEFGDGGLITIPFSQCAGGFDSLSEVEVQADGKILVAGHSYEPPWTPGPFVFRFDSAGEPDSSFGTAGRVCLSNEQFPGWINLPRISRQADGKIIAVAYGSSYPALKRINSDGSTDTTFNPRYVSSGSQDVLVQNGDGKVVVYTQPQTFEPEGYTLIRYLP